MCSNVDRYELSWHIANKAATKIIIKLESGVRNKETLGFRLLQRVRREEIFFKPKS